MLLHSNPSARPLKHAIADHVEHVTRSALARDTNRRWVSGKSLGFWLGTLACPQARRSPSCGVSVESKIAQRGPLAGCLERSHAGLGYTLPIYAEAHKCGFSDVSPEVLFQPAQHPAKICPAR